MCYRSSGRYQGKDPWTAGTGPDWRVSFGTFSTASRRASTVACTFYSKTCCSRRYQLCKHLSHLLFGVVIDNHACIKGLWCSISIRWSPFIGYCHFSIVQFIVSTISWILNTLLLGQPDSWEVLVTFYCNMLCFQCGSSCGMNPPQQSPMNWGMVPRT